jgi:cobalamin biosynthetic protein CobC
MLEHGGQLRKAAEHYGIPLEQWLDLSTGINPHSYLPPQIPLAVWAHLPQEQDGLEQAAAAYYGTAELLPVAGSQAAIQVLPRLREACRVGVLHPGYAEHAYAWLRCGHAVQPLARADIDEAALSLDVLVLMQPCNPSGITFTPDELRTWHARLAARGGWLVVDEAFIEATELASAIQAQMPQGLIVLRSVGKFFGLAGARVGFVAAHPDLLESLREWLGPWCIPGASRFAVKAALLDRTWQVMTRQRLLQKGARLAQLLRQADLTPTGGCGLFQWVETAQAEAIHRRLAQQGILTRLFAEPSSLRFGLPGTAAGWERLRESLCMVSAE